MARITSKTQVDKLGERLCKSESLSTSDLQMLQAVRLEYAPVLERAQRVLAEIGLDATSRLKTSNTIIEKLRREKTRLSAMQDLAGMRVVREMSLVEQDELVVKIQQAVEIQIRTALQHRWAEVVEKIADEWGRQIRYGEPPDEPAKAEMGGTRQEALELLLSSSKGIAEVEEELPKAEMMIEELRAKGAHVSEVPYAPLGPNEVVEMSKTEVLSRYRATLNELDQTIRHSLEALTSEREN